MSGAMVVKSLQLVCFVRFDLGFDPCFVRVVMYVSSGVLLSMFCSACAALMFAAALAGESEDHLRVCAFLTAPRCLFCYVLASLGTLCKLLLSPSRRG